MKRSSITFTSLVAIWVVLSLAQLWGGPLSAEIYTKISLSFLLIGGTIFFCSLISNEHLTGDLRLASGVAIGSIIVWVMLSLAQLWSNSNAIDASLYLKLTITMLLIGGGILVVSIIRREYKSEKKLKKNNFID
ncbi:MAG: hypothetical protein P8I97_00840 [Verrucomicrobiales bacterium]|nr:hypothetical protein [Verrucomicrobiales bacterium]